MKFARVSVDNAEGVILAHSIKVLERKWKKGRVLSRHDIDVLQQEGYDSVVGASLDDNDIDEDSAAEAVARVIAGHGVEVRPAATGRCNIYASVRGLLDVRGQAVERINGFDEAFTAATLPSYTNVYSGQLLATVKIIPFAVSRQALNQCVAIAAKGAPPINVYEYQNQSVGLIQTQTPWFKSSLLDKGLKMLRQRVQELGLEILEHQVCEHHEDAVAAAVNGMLNKGLDLILVLGACAIQDRGDVVPQGIVNAGGRIDHFGMPVDPGNLLLLARHRRTVILGLPGCVRSPKRNGFDFVFERIAAGMDIRGEDITKMGVGGVLAEPSRRPERRSAKLPSSQRREAKKVAAIVLAAGQSRRMGEHNKLLMKINRSTVIRTVVSNLMESDAEDVYVATGHDRDLISKELSGLPVTLIHNPEYSRGLSTSLRTVLAAIPGDIDGILVCLGDMPFVNSEHINMLIESFNPIAEHGICVPTYKGKRGNPVLWDRRYIQEMMEVRGDTGAKHMIGDYDDFVIEVETDSCGVVTDLDTPEAFNRLKSLSATSDTEISE